MPKPSKLNAHQELRARAMLEETMESVSAEIEFDGHATFTPTSFVKYDFSTPGKPIVTYYNYPTSP